MADMNIPLKITLELTPAICRRCRRAWPDEEPKPEPTLTERLRDIAHDGITRDGKGRGCAAFLVMAADLLEHLESLVPLYEAVVEAADRSAVFPGVGAKRYDDARDALRAAQEETS